MYIYMYTYTRRFIVPIRYSCIGLHKDTNHIPMRIRYKHRTVVRKITNIIVFFLIFFTYTLGVLYLYSNATGRVDVNR